MSDISSLGPNYTDYYAMTSSSSRASEKADSVAGKASGLTKDSSREDIEDAVKSFESYFLEQVLKQEKKAMEAFSSDDEDKDAYASQMEDLYMDKAVETISSDIVDQYAGRLTDDFADQIQRNLGVSEADIKANR